MINTSQNLFSEMKSILQHVIDTNLASNYSDKEWLLIKECYDAGYLDGAVVLQMASGRVVAEISKDQITLTPAGQRFMDS